LTLSTAHTVALSGLASGATYHYRVSSADASANAAASSDATFVTATVDTTAPSVSVTAPTQGATVAGTVTISAAATDDTRVAAVQFLLDGANLGAEATASPYTTSWATTVATNGAHTLSARARDGAGNQATSAAIGVIVANVTPPAIDTVMFADQPNTRLLRTGKFATSAANELLLAFVSAGDSAAGNTVTAVTGAGLAWSLVRRTNAQRGTAEIWRAFAAAPLAGASVDVQFAQQAPASVTIVSLSRVDTSGAGGSGAVGAIASASAPTGAPAATLVTTRNNSLVFGVGDDWSAAAARKVGSTQTLVHQFLSGGKTLWVQRTTAAVPMSGTNVIVNDTSPATDRFNLTICEVLGR
jgi:Bacterial Ig domain